LAAPTQLDDEVKIVNVVVIGLALVTWVLLMV
jgi:hypothetical protein